MGHALPSLYFNPESLPNMSQNHIIVESQAYFVYNTLGWLERQYGVMWAPDWIAHVEILAFPLPSVCVLIPVTQLL